MKKQTDKSGKVKRPRINSASKNSNMASAETSAAANARVNDLVDELESGAPVAPRKIPLETPLNVVLFPTSKQTETSPNFSGKITNDKGDTVAQILMYDKTTYKGVKRWQGMLLDGGGGSERIAMDLIENTEEGANPPDIRSMLFVEGVSYSIILWRKTYAYGTYFSGRIG